MTPACGKEMSRHLYRASRDNRSETIPPPRAAFHAFKHHGCTVFLHTGFSYSRAGLSCRSKAGTPRKRQPAAAGFTPRGSRKFNSSVPPYSPAFQARIQFESQARGNSCREAGVRDVPVGAFIPPPQDNPARRGQR
jgi:hypothetical protein